MLGAKKLFTSGKMMSIAERGLPMSRLITGRKHKITAVPGIVGGWTAYRDIPEPPKESSATGGRRRRVRLRHAITHSALTFRPSSRLTRVRQLKRLQTLRLLRKPVKLRRTTNVLC